MGHKYLPNWCFHGATQTVLFALIFSSVAAALYLKQMGLCFIGVIKTGTNEFPMSWLQQVELPNRGDMEELVAKDSNGIPELLSFVWVDHDHHYFIASLSSLDEEIPYTQNGLQQVECD